MTAKLKPYKKDFDHSYAVGVFPTLELLTHQPGNVLGILLSSRADRNKGAIKIGELCKAKGIRVEIEDRLVDKLAGNENSYAIGVFRKYESALRPTADHLVLVNPNDMGNVGTIMRSMAGFDMLDLALVQPAVDVFDPKVIRASMGAIFQLRFACVGSFGAYQKLFARNMYPFMTDGRQSLEKVCFQSPFALVFGPEGAGLGEEYRAIGTSVTIPQSKRVDSLNLSLAAGISLYKAYISKRP